MAPPAPFASTPALGPATPSARFRRLAAFAALATGCLVPPEAAPARATSDMPSPAPSNDAGTAAAATQAPPLLDATIDVDAATTINTFQSLRVFGNNVPAWVDPVPVKDKIQAAGNYLLRIPGGSWGDVYHWNGKGTVDQGTWKPSDVDYAPSVLEKDSTGKYASSRAVDGDDKTAWVSNTDTDYPNAQWIYLDLGQAREVDEADVVWGNVAERTLPFAKRLSVQYWNPAEARQWMVYGAEKSAWLDAVKDVRGTGGPQKIPFPKVKTQYLRLLFQESSAGKGGAYAIAEVKASAEGHAVALAPSNPCVAGSTKVALSGMDSRKVFGFEDYMALFASFSPRAAIPLVIVNFGTGTPREAAAWVHYANRVKHYGIKYWEIGNEVGGHWEAGGPVNVRDYARRYIQFYEAMRKEDPLITIIAQTGYAEASGVYDGVPSLKDFTDRLAADKKERELDAFSVHQYPNWGQRVADLVDSPKRAMLDMASSIKDQLGAYPALGNVPVWISEFNTSDHVLPQDISVRLDNGLWLAQYLGEFIRNFGARGYATLWDVMNGGKATTDPQAGDHGYLQAEDGPYHGQERADYWTMQLLATTWALPGDERDHRLVESVSSAAPLATYAAVRPDGQLALLVVNKELKNAYRASLRIKGFKPKPGAQAWTFDATNYRWNTDAPPYHADPDRAPTPWTLDTSSQERKFTFPAYSISVVQFEPDDR